MTKRDFRDMEDVMAKTSLTNEGLAYRLKKFYDECKANYTKTREAKAKINREFREREKIKKRRAERKEYIKKAKQLEQYKRDM